VVRTLQLSRAAPRLRARGLRGSDEHLSRLTTPRRTNEPTTSTRARKVSIRFEVTGQLWGMQTLSCLGVDCSPASRPAGWRKAEALEMEKKNQGQCRLSE
jgi:hypothetical protein